MDDMTVSASMVIAYFSQMSFTLCEHMSYCIRDIRVSDADIASQISRLRWKRCMFALFVWSRGLHQNEDDHVHGEDIFFRTIIDSC